MEPLKVTGGVKVGEKSDRWPFTTLKVDKEKLELNSTFAGKFVFKSTDIISIKPYTAVPLIIKGVKITHRVSNYPSKVIFWTTKSPAKLVDRIKQTGFLDSVNSSAATFCTKATTHQAKEGFAIKTSATIAFVVIWNVSFLIYFLFGKHVELPSEIATLIAMGFVILTCIMGLTYKPFRRMILKEGRTLEDIQNFMYFILFVCGFIFLGTILMYYSTTLQ